MGNTTNNNKSETVYRFQIEPTNNEIRKGAQFLEEETWRKRPNDEKLRSDTRTFPCLPRRLSSVIALLFISCSHRSSDLYSS
jgi:hypothetical protein